MTSLSQKTHIRVKALQELETECLSQMDLNGIPFAGPLKITGKIQRFSRDAKTRKPDEWYVAHMGVSSRRTPYLNVDYGSWSDGSKFKYNSYIGDDSLSSEDLQEIRERAEEAKRQSEKEIAEEHERVAVEAQKIWLAAFATPEEAAAASKIDPRPKPEDYLRYSNSKGIQVYDARFADNPNGYPSLVMRLYNIEGQTRSLQFISMDHDAKSYKTFLSGGEKRGNFCVLGKLKTDSRTYVCEGWATGCSIHQATGEAVILTFDAGNLEPVVANLLQKFSGHLLTIAGDDDVENEKNPGRKKAEEAASKHCCRVIFPKFPDDLLLQNGKRPTDFNDLHAQRGLDEVRKQLQDEGKSEATWPDPQPIQGTIFPVAWFQTDKLLPEYLRDWVLDEAERMPCPVEFIAGSAIVALGAIIGARCAIMPKAHDNWSVVPNLWGGIVGLPSDKKSPSISAAMKPLERLISKATSDYNSGLKAFETSKTVYEAKKAAVESKIKSAAKDSKNCDIAALATELTALQDDAPGAPVHRRFKTNDSTVEALGELLRANPTGLLVLRDELVGLIASWEKAGHEGDRSFFLEGWNGNSSFDTDRIKKGGSSHSKPLHLPFWWNSTGQTDPLFRTNRSFSLE